MQSGPALDPGSLISESVRILEVIFQDPFYTVYSAESAASGAKLGITEYFPAELVARAPSGEVLLRSLELHELFNLGRERFMAEARALSALRHPNLLRFDGVLSDQGTVFALHAAEEGQSIALERAPEQVPSQDDIDARLKPLLSALHLLHSRGLIHSNITPYNILLRPEPLLVRFGATRGYLAARMRKVNLAVTPGYSAPELHFADEKAHGPLCDIFSLAAVLYFVVTGRHPINVIARGLGQTMPPAAASQKFRPEFLEAIDRGLELEPERRPQSIEAFGEMLFGIREKSAPEIRQPALQMAAQGERGQPGAPPPPPGLSNSSPSPSPSRPLRASSASNGYDGTEDDEEDEAHDFESGWRGLGLGKIIIAVGALVLLISAGLWLSEAQFSKQPEQGPQPIVKADASPTPGTAEVPVRQSPVARAPASKATPGKPEPEAAGTTASEKGTFEAPLTRPAESPARPQAEPPAETQREASIAKPEAKTGGDAYQAPPADSTVRHLPDREDLKPVQPPVPAPKAVEMPSAKTDAAAPAQPPAPPSDKPAQPQNEPVTAAKAGPVPPPVQPSASSPAQLKFKDCDVCPPLVVVAAGEFAMGSNENPHEKPVHKVKIPAPFAIGQYEVTYAEWDACVDAGACRYRPDHQGPSSDPVGNLSWDDANAYLKWLSEKTKQTYRLPSEAEWEYAARAGSHMRFWWGDEAGANNANCGDTKSETNHQLASAGSYKVNPFGLYDTAGNVAEWVQDCWNETYKGAPSDGSAWVKGNCALRGLRGGSFGNKAAFCRSAARFRYDSDVRYESNGFRVLRELR